MEIKEILHMTQGDEEFSYVHNSTTQGRTFSMLKPIIQNVIKLQLGENNVMRRPCKALKIADLGCGVGPNPVALITLLIETVRQRCKDLSLNEDQVPEIHIYVNDLPSNDFNSLFKNVTNLQINQRKDGKPLCLIMAAPGSFYDRLLPSNSMHIVHSNYSLHWLSQVPLGLTDEVSMPLNKNNIVATETSHPKVIKAYFAQFQQDFTAFLNYRSREIVPNGHIVLAILGRSTVTLWQPPHVQFLHQALHNLVLKGVVEDEKLDSFNMPTYFPNQEEISSIVSQEGSFAIQNISFVIDDVEKHITDLNLKAEIVAKCIRSFSEALVSSHFGSQVWKMLQNELYQVVLTHLDSNRPTFVFNIIILLKRKMD